MLNEQKTYWTDDPELVEKYVLGQLSDQERKRLEAEIADCKPCKEKLRRELQLAAGIRRYGREQMKSRMRMRLRQKQSQGTFRYQYIGLAAAVVVIALAVGVYRVWFNDVERPHTFGHKEIIFTQKDTTHEQSTSTEEPEKDTADYSGSISRPSVVQSQSRPPSPVLQGASGGDDEQRSNAARQDVVGVKKRADETRRQSALSESVEERATGNTLAVQSIWLIGKVVMIEDRMPATAQDSQPQTLMMEKTEKQSSQRFESQGGTMSIKRGKRNEYIVLEQKSYRELPRSRQSQIGRKNLIETLVQQRGDSLHLTLYSDSITHTDIEHAAIETIGSDSLIVTTGSSRIYYKLPALLQSQQRR
jgi:hypothetical protein